MSNAVIGYVNAIDAAATMLSGGGDVASLPVQNVQDPQPRKPYRTIGTAAYFVADFGTQTAIEAVALVATSLTEAGTLRVRLSTSDATGAAGDAYDTGVTAAGADPRYLGNVLNIPASTKTGRYLRVDLADSSLAYIDIGRCYAGPLFRPGRNMSYGAGIGYLDFGTKQRGRGGQLFSKAAGRARYVTATFNNLTQIEAMTQALELDRLIGNTGDVLFVMDPESTYLAQTWLWGVVADMTLISVPQFSLYSKAYRIEERI
jgi:hypothetical protein